MQKTNKLERFSHFVFLAFLHRYILLIDDIWSVETWENIRNWLPLEKDSKGSKVIVTSRFQAVGAACSG